MRCAHRQICSCFVVLQDSASGTSFATLERCPVCGSSLITCCPECGFPLLGPFKPIPVWIIQRVSFAALTCRVFAAKNDLTRNWSRFQRMPILKYNSGGITDKYDIVSVVSAANPCTKNGAAPKDIRSLLPPKSKAPVMRDPLVWQTLVLSGAT